MNKSMTILPFVVTALLVGTPARADDKTSEIDKISSWATPSRPGCTVAVSQRRKVVVHRAYGLADLERDVPITPDTIFDAASVVKQCVAAATLLLVDADDLKALADRYTKDETRAVFEMEPGNASLIVRVSWNDTQAFDFRPVDRDTFQWGRMILRFRQDDGGKVVGLDYSNPLVRTIRFTR